MTLDDLSPEHRAFLGALTGLDPKNLHVLWGLPESEMKEVTRRRRAALAIDNAIKDFQTVILGSQTISAEEDWVRLWILRCSQFMPSRYLYVATFGDEGEFERLARNPSENDEPWFLILKYIRATRSPQSATEHCRGHFLGFPSEPPEELQEMFLKLVHGVRSRDRNFI